MKILILNGSHRKNGNCSNFSEVANNILSQKHVVNVCNLIDCNIKPCNGCLNCEEGMHCPLIDDYSKHIVDCIKEADLLIFATPTYFNMPSAAMVNLIDRTNNLCEYLAEAPKKVFTYISGQTDEDSMTDAYNCLKTYFDIMALEEIESPIFHVARFREDLPEKIYDLLKKI